MLKGKVNLLKKELKKLNLNKEVRVFLAFVNKAEDKVVVQHNRITIFKGSYPEYTESFLKWSIKNGSINKHDLVVSMDWNIRRPDF